MPDGNVDKVREEIENVLRLSTINYGIQTEVKYTASRDHKYGGRPAEVSVSLGSIKILESINNMPSTSPVCIAEVQLGVKKGEEDKTNQFLDSLIIYDLTKDIANLTGKFIREC